MPETPEIYTAHYMWNAEGEGIPQGGCYAPEILHHVIGRHDGLPPMFCLAKEAWVGITGDPEHPWVGTWGGLREKYLTKRKPLYDEFEVQILRQVWRCDAKAIMRNFSDFATTITRRNRQIEDLRSQLARVKVR